MHLRQKNYLFIHYTVQGTEVPKDLIFLSFAQTLLS